MSSEKICFIISPIGEPDSEIRKLADEKYDLVFEPVLVELGYTPIRADKENSPNSISRGIVTRLLNSELVIADASGFNANVFYELAIRNAIKKPVIIVKELGQKLPFDVTDKRSISINMKDNRQWVNAKEELKQHIKNAEKDPKSASESIVSEYAFDLDVSKTPNTEQEMVLVVKDLKDEIRTLRNDVRRQNPRIPRNISPIEESEIEDIRIRNNELTRNEELSIRFKSGYFDIGDTLKIEVFDPKGSLVWSRESRGSPNLVGISYNVSEFANENGKYKLLVSKNQVAVYAAIFNIT